MWSDATIYLHNGEGFVVCHRHQIRRVVTDDGAIDFLGFKLHPFVSDGDADLWMTTVRFGIERQRRIILASTQNRSANLVHVVASEFTDRSFVLELGQIEIPDFSLPPRIEPKRREFFPNTFNANDDYTIAFLDALGPTQGQINEARRQAAIWRRGQR